MASSRDVPGLESWVGPCVLPPDPDAVDGDLGLFTGPPLALPVWPVRPVRAE